MTDREICDDALAVELSQYCSKEESGGHDVGLSSERDNAEVTKPWTVLVCGTTREFEAQML